MSRIIYIYLYIYNIYCMLSKVYMLMGIPWRVIFGIRGESYVVIGTETWQIVKFCDSITKTCQVKGLFIQIQAIHSYIKNNKPQNWAVTGLSDSTGTTLCHKYTYQLTRYRLYTHILRGSRTRYLLRHSFATLCTPTSPLVLFFWLASTLLCSYRLLVLQA